jgi:hypothetical protein
MPVARAISLALRSAQFVCAAIVLGLSTYFLHQYDTHHIGPFNRLAFSTIISSVSLWIAIIWMLHGTASLVHIGADLFFCAAWFAVFGLFQDYYDDQIKCGSVWNWGNIDLTNNYCGQWNAAQAFSFLSAVGWFASFLVGVLAWRRARHPVATDGALVPPR